MTYDNLIDRSDAAALMPEDVARDIIQGVARQSYVLSLATRLPDMPRKTRRMPVLSVLPTAYFVNGDTGLKQTTEVSWQNKFITAEEIAVIVPVPNIVLDDSAYDIWGEVRPHIETAFGKLIDATMLYGGLPGYTRPSNDWPEGVVTSAMAGGMALSLAGAADLYDATLGEFGTFHFVEEAGFSVTGNVAAVSMRAKLRGARDSDGHPIFSRNANGAFDLDGSPIVFPENGSVDTSQSLLVSGDFRQLVFAVRTDINYTIATSGVITDNNNTIIYNLFQQDMTAMKVIMRLGWQLPNPPNWLKPNNNDATRYPFAVLTP
ncbi:MAG: phage major capsid protein [Candidatus Viridilinea halotolerans]|uniref:Phage major capsid protein n=1 Tax=Candidatus Viridilinea halotolerans TaxID=2491704 RepID=A0A426TVU6_9CHLR|nr:MAG: phage major capsid protein [Candidatus Viridilinea halotolerans]